MGALMFVTGTNAMAQESSETPTGVVVHGNVYGGGNQAGVKINTEVNMSTGTVEGNVYGGGNLGDVGTHADQDPASVGNYVWTANTGLSKVTITGGTVGVENSAKPKEQGNVFGGGKGEATTFECEKGMVYKTNVSIKKSGTTNTLVYRNVYGGGEVSRVENDTEVTIGTASGTDEPNIKGSVFAAGAGVETHGYSALVRGHSTVTVQGKATVEHNVYGGGELASVGRYKVKTPANASDTDVPATLPYGMPAHLINGGKNTVTITDNAVIGTEGDNTTGHVYGAGKGLEPREYDYASQTEGDTEYDIDDHQPKRMVSGNTWEHFANVAAYLQFVETLALTAETEVTITGSAGVIGSVFGGSESGFVYQDTEVKIQNGTINGNVFGGGRGLESFAEAGRVKGNTTVTMSNGSVAGNVYGGGNLGDVGTIYKDAKDEYGNLTYNYVWRNSDANGNVNDTEHNNTTEYNKPSGSSHDTSKNTGVCNVTINGGTIGTGVTQNSDGTFTKGNVYGAGRGSDITWWCEKAIAYATNVTITAGTVNGTVYGGGQVGRVEDDAKVTIGVADATGDAAPIISGNVFGAGAGLHTHGYSALVRGNSDVTVQGTAQVGGSVYGGGEIASVGKFRVDKGLPKEPLSGGYCTVTIQDNAKIGTSGTEHNVYGACKGVDPATINSSDRMSMQLFANRPKDANGNYKAENDGWSYYPSNHAFVWVTYTEDDYPAFLRTLALTSHPHVTIAESASVFGSVYGGGQRGITLGNVDVDITGGIVEKDVYGGGALADTNAGNWDADDFTEVTGLTADVSSVTGLYTLSGTTYTIITDEDAKAVSGTTYYSKGKWADATKMTGKYTTTVDLTGGYIKGDAYGGGLGQKTGFNSALSNIEATVWGDIDVTLNGTKFDITYYEDEGYTDVVKSGRVFGCNNLLGSPQGDVTVTVERTVAGNYSRTTGKVMEMVDGEMQEIDKRKSQDPDNHSYELAAVYGGGNLAPYETTGKKAHVIIKGCDLTSILTVYGGGNAAPVPETDVDIHSCYEIGSVFGGGNGKDKYKNDSGWQTNPGANVGTAEQPGNANTMIYGGTVHEAYGASNEQGTIYGNVIIDVADGYPGETPKCPLDVAKLVGAGKNADVNGDLILVMGCKPYEKIPFVYGGADNANVNGDVELTITSGWFGKVFGGNNENGCIMGHIKLNIEETGTCGTPIKIDELYLGGNKAAYSQYGYYYDGTDAEGKPILKPRTAAMAAITDPTAEGYTPTITTAQYGSEIRKTAPYDAPELNIISCTYIGEVFGGGLGEAAVMYADPTVNINMEPGALAKYIDRDKNGTPDDTSGKLLGTIVDVYGGGNAAAVCGTTTVNIGTETEVQMTSVKDPNTNELLTSQPKHTVTGAYITGDVYGGGKLANVGETHLAKDSNNKDIDVIDIEGSTFVNIGAVKGAEIVDDQNNPTGRYNYTSVSFTPADAPGIFIGGNVYGGGMGEAAEPEGTDALPGAFRCGKAMVTKNTNVAIGNGTIGDGNADHGHVYGGGEKGRVEENTSVTIGCENDENSKPVITGNVFGAGKGVNTHGYSALARGNSYVTVQGEAKVKKSVYGGGEIASVGKYNINAQGLPESLANQGSGYCTVIVRDNAVIGPDAAMVMTATGYPDDMGHVFGAGKGVLPYEGYADNEKAWRVTPGNTKQEYLSKTEAIAGTNEEGYLPYVETLGLATQTYVTIDENAFVKGSVYGGSENGYVQHHTQVNIRGNCQIGNGYVQMDNNGIYLDKLDTPKTPMGVNRRYTAAEWAAGRLFPENDPDYTTGTDTELENLVSSNNYYTSSLPECASWPYGQATGDDKYAPWDTYADVANYDSKGGRTTADDGHTFYGNVFGGGSGVIPYRPGKWHPEAGSVGGNTEVNITGGHILTNIYGGNELTDVYGKCTVNFGGTATLGVPRTLKQIAAHPLTCYLFGAGKGDQRVLFNKSTNVKDVEVNITGGTIYGSVFGGGEDGHVHRDVKMTIGKDDHTGPTIGQWGTSYVDGNIFGGGRGFGADAYTAGNVAGSVKMEIKGGSIRGSIYGGGRLGSVGYGLFESTDNTGRYGSMRPDNKSDDASDSNTDYYTKGAVGLGRGHIDITISGGTIGNDLEYIIPNATNMEAAGIPVADRDISKWNDTNKYWDTWKTYHNIPKTEFDTTTGRVSHTKGGNVFAGGMGNFYKQDGKTPISDVNWWQLGCVKTTKVTISGGTIKSTVFGGGELGQVVGYHTAKNAANSNVNVGTEVIINGGTIGTELQESNVTRFIYGSVFGGGYGSLKETHGTASNVSYPKYIAGRVKAGTKVAMTAGEVRASVYGGGKMAAVGESKTLGETLTEGHTGDTHVMVSGGTIGEAPITLSDGSLRYFGGAKVGNVYGGGSGSNNTVRSGHIYGNTNVTISGGTIYHNVYGGGAYGTVGDFDYITREDPVTHTNKVFGVSGINTGHPNSGVATVTITNGTIGYDGKENGMIFGSSRGDINQPEERDDYTAWVYNANVTIGTAGTPASGTEGQEGYVPATNATGPEIKGSVYGSGENGHTFNNTVVTVNGGKIGIDDSNDDGYSVTSNDKTYEGAAYPYRGNVYGGGCGTDKYYSNHSLENHSGEGDYYNPLAGIVYGTSTVNINDGTVVRNVYGAGAMGSVGKTTWTTTTTGEGEEATTVTTATTAGGSTMVNINGGIIGTTGTVGDGNVFGAARGSKDIVQADYINDLSSVSVTNVTVSGGTVKGNVYGGGELGDVGTIIKNTSDYNYTWQKTGGGANTDNNNDITGTNTNTGICNVTITGGTIGSSTAGTGNVFGGGKGDANTWWCEKAMAFATNVSVSEASGATTKVFGTVYGGGEIGRVEDDSKVIIGTADGSDTPEIVGSVFGAGKGLATRGYSALVRGNSVVTIQGSSQVGGSVFGGGEEASLGRFVLDRGLPKSPLTGGSATVTIQDQANIGSNGTDNDVYGAGKGVDPATITADNRKSMQLEGNKPEGNEGDTWDYYIDDDNKKDERFVWVYYKTEAAYQSFLNTLAIASHPTVTIAEDATVYGDVYGGGQRGITLGRVDVNITGGTVKQDVYGGGSLADTNKGNWEDNTWATGRYDATTHATDFKTNVTLTGGTVDRNVYGGGLGQLANSGQSAVEAKVYGDVLVKLNEPKTTTSTTGEGEEATTTTTTTYGDCVVKGKIFGSNNLNGSPQSSVTVHIYKTTDYAGHEKDNAKSNTKFNVDAVYGGGNLAAYKPDLVATADSAKAYVFIDGCDLTSIKSVYGGGNAASVPATKVVVNGTYEIGEVFGGGNGKDNVSYDGVSYVTNPGANVGYLAYTDDSDKASKAYGSGKAHATIYGGTVHTVYGGSNLRGNVRVESRTTLQEGSECAFNVGDAYGGGNNANQDGDAVLEIGCISGLDKAYGGASDADVDGNVVLTITNGTYGQVFGGNDAGGAIRGSITVNIEETGCNPIIIGELYGGGCNAAYSVYGYNADGSVKETGDNPVADPVVNVKSFTSIGTVYGGGYGRAATMVGNPEVNINVVKGKYSGQTSETYFTNNGFVLDPNDNKRYSKTVDNDGSANSNPHTVYVPTHEVGNIGAIYNVFGGGNAAAVIGTPHVNIGTKVGEVIPLTSKPIEDSEGRTPSQEGWTPSYEIVTVEGVDIRGNVYGAGNNAQVTGNTEVVIGKNNDVKTYSFTSYSASNGGDVWSSGLAQTTGKYVTLGDSKLAEVEILTNGKYDEYVGKKFYVDPEGSGRLQLYNADKEATSLWVSIEPFVYKTYSFKSYGASSGGTEYSTGTAAPTGNFKEFDGTEYMQIVVLTNPGEASWVGKTFYVPANAETNGNARTQLHKANGDPVNVWVSIEL